MRTPSAQQCPNRCRGFTLIELLVVTGILVLVSTLMFSNNARFGGVVFLENLAYDVALSLRKAQVYGIAVRRFGDDDFSAGYGINFSASTPSTYVLFADASEDGVYNSGANEDVELSTMHSGYRAAELCVTATIGAGEVCSLTTLDILFKRPEPDAYIRANGLSSIYERGRILLESPRGDQISVIVEVTGQITVQRVHIAEE